VVTSLRMDLFLRDVFRDRGNRGRASHACRSGLKGRRGASELIGAALTQRFVHSLHTFRDLYLNFIESWIRDEHNGAPPPPPPLPPFCLFLALVSSSSLFAKHTLEVQVPAVTLGSSIPF